MAFASSHRRHAPSQATPSLTKAAAPTPTAAAAAAAASGDGDSYDHKYRKPGIRKSLPRKILEMFLVLALGSFIIGQIVASRKTSSEATSNSNTGGVVLGGGGGTRGSSSAVEVSSTGKVTTRLPPIVRSSAQSSAASAASAASLQTPSDPRYGTEPLTGRSTFFDSPGCRKEQQSAGDGSKLTPVTPVICTAYHPEVELSHHLDREEALDGMQQQQGRIGAMRGMRGIVNANAVGVGGAAGGQQPPAPLPPNTAVMGTKIPIDPGADDNVAILTRHGYKGGLPGGQINQDRAVVIAPYLLSQLPSSGGGAGGGVATTHDFLMSLFDGHGERGHATSELAVRTFPSLLAEKMAAVPINDAGDGYEEDGLREAATAAYKEIDDRAATISGAGATATSILRVGDRLYYINTGDSQSFLGTYIKSKKQAGVAFITSEHKPHLPEEKKRIESMGGQVMMPPQPPPGMNIKLSSRVLAILPNGFQLGLAMSRSIGDPEAGKLGVIPTPDIAVLSISDVRARTAAEAGVDPSDVELFAVVASDGIYDHVEPEEVASTFGSALYGGDRPPDAKEWSPLRACEKLIMTSSERWVERLANQGYRDDISIAVSKVLI